MKAWPFVLFIYLTLLLSTAFARPFIYSCFAMTHLSYCTAFCTCIFFCAPGTCARRQKNLDVHVRLHYSRVINFLRVSSNSVGNVFI